MPINFGRDIVLRDAARQAAVTRINQDYARRRQEEAEALGRAREEFRRRQEEQQRAALEEAARKAAEEQARQQAEAEARARQQAAIQAQREREQERQRTAGQGAVSQVNQAAQLARAENKINQFGQRDTMVNNANNMLQNAARERAAMLLADRNRVNSSYMMDDWNSDPMISQLRQARDRRQQQGQDTSELDEQLRDQWGQVTDYYKMGRQLTLDNALNFGADPEKEERQRMAEEAAKAAIDRRTQESAAALGDYAQAEKRVDDESQRINENETSQEKARQEAYATARRVAMDLGYKETEIPATLDELLQDERINGNLDVWQAVQNLNWYKWRGEGINADYQKAQEQASTVKENLTEEDLALYGQYTGGTSWKGKLVNPLSVNPEQNKETKLNILTGMISGEYGNQEAYNTAIESMAELDRWDDIKANPGKYVEEVDERIAFLEGLNGKDGYWADESSGVGKELTYYRRQRELLTAADLDKEEGYEEGVAAGRAQWAAENGIGEDYFDELDESGGDRSSEKYREVDATMVYKGNQPVRGSDLGNMTWMTKDERDRYFYLYSQDPQRAEDYMDAMRTEIAERRTGYEEEAIVRSAEAHPVLTSALSTVEELTKPVNALGTLVENVVQGKEYFADSQWAGADRYQSTVRDTTKKGLKSYAEERGWNPAYLTAGYDIIMNVGDNLVRAFGSRLMGITNSKITTGMMAFGAAGSTTRELLEQGVEPTRAAMVGGVAAFAEYITEKWSDAEWFKGIDEGYTGMKNLLKSVLQSSVQEGWTEVASDLISMAGEAALLGDDSSYQQLVNDYYFYTGDMDEARKLAFQDQLGQELYTLMISAVSGGLMEGTTRIVSTDWKTYRENKMRERQQAAGATQADTAQDSHGDQAAAEAAAENAADQTGDADLEEALAAAAAPMVQEDQQADAERGEYTPPAWQQEMAPRAPDMAARAAAFDEAQRQMRQQFPEYDAAVAELEQIETLDEMNPGEITEEQRDATKRQLKLIRYINEADNYAMDLASQITARETAGAADQTAREPRTEPIAAETAREREARLQGQDTAMEEAWAESQARQARDADNLTERDPALTGEETVTRQRVRLRDGTEQDMSQEEIDAYLADPSRAGAQLVQMDDGTWQEMSREEAEEHWRTTRERLARLEMERNPLWRYGGEENGTEEGAEQPGGIRQRMAAWMARKRQQGQQAGPQESVPPEVNKMGREPKAAIVEDTYTGMPVYPSRDEESDGKGSLGRDVMSDLLEGINPEQEQETGAQEVRRPVRSKMDRVSDEAIVEDTYAGMPSKAEEQTGPRESVPPAVPKMDRTPKAAIVEDTFAGLPTKKEEQTGPRESVPPAVPKMERTPKAAIVEDTYAGMPGRATITVSDRLPEAVNRETVRRGDLLDVSDRTVSAENILENLKPGTVEDRIAHIPSADMRLLKQARQEGTRKVLDSWGTDVEGESDEDLARDTWLAAIKGCMHNQEQDGIHDDHEWRKVALNVWDDLFNQLGAELGKRSSRVIIGDNGLHLRRDTVLGPRTMPLFARVNNPLLDMLQPTEQAAIVLAAQNELIRRNKEKSLKARAEAEKYGFRSALWDDASEGLGRGVVIKTATQELTKNQVLQLRVLDNFNRELQLRGLRGIDVEVYDSITEGGTHLNGSYSNTRESKRAAVISIALDAEGADMSNLLRAAGHELYHMTEKWDKKGAEQLRKTVLDKLQTSGTYNLEERIRQLRELYGEDADVESEIVADSMFGVLGSEEQVAEIFRQNQGLGTRIKGWIAKITDALKAAGQRLAGMGSKEAEALNGDTETLSAIRDMWTRSVETSLRNQQLQRITELEGGENLGKLAGLRAVLDAQTEEDRTAALGSLTDEIILKTQNELAGTVEEEMAANREKMRKALTEFANGEKTMDAALTGQGLKTINSESTRRVAAWLGRELVASEEARASLRTLSEEARFNRIWNEDAPEGDPDAAALAYVARTPAEKILSAMYEINAEKERKGKWREHLDTLVDELTDGTMANKKKVKSMITRLYTAIDKDNRVHTSAATEYAQLIGNVIAQGTEEVQMEQYQTTINETDREILRGIKGATISLDKVLGEQVRQWNNKGEYYKNKKLAWGDINTLGETVKELNNRFAPYVTFRLRDGKTKTGTDASTIIDETPGLAAILGVNDPNASYSEPDKLIRLMEWMEGRVQQMSETNERMRDLPRAVAEERQLAQKIILGYFDYPGVMDETQRAVDAVRTEMENENARIREEAEIYKGIIGTQGGIIESLAKDANRARRLQELAERRAKRINDRIEITKARDAISRQLNTMRQWLYNPTKEAGKHTSEEYRGTIAAALRLVDTSSRNNPDSVRSIDFAALQSAIEQEFSDPTGTSGYVDAQLIDTLKELEETCKDKLLIEMEAGELNAVKDCLAQIIKISRDADKARTDAIKTRISTLCDGLIANLQQARTKKERRAALQRMKSFIDYSMTDPVRFFDLVAREGGSAGTVMWETLRKDGMDTQINLMEEAKRRFAEAFDKLDYKDWAGGAGQRVSTFDLSSGEQIQLTDGQIMDLYLLNKREQGRRHIYGQGIAQGRAEVRGKVYKSERPVAVTEADVRMICSALSQEQIAAADALQKIVGVWCSELGNQTSMLMYGYRKFKEEAYFPIKTLKDQHGVRGTELEQDRRAESLYAIANPGFSKELNKKATNAVVLENAFDVAMDHVVSMINYRAWAAPLTDLTRILNYKSEGGDTVVRELNRVLGEDGTNYYVQLLRDINGINADQIEKKAAAFNTMHRNFKSASVAFNFGTVIKQVLSIVRAFDVVPSHYFLTARQLTERFGKAKEIDALMTQYAPIYAWKQDGRFTMNTGRDAKSVLLPKTIKTINKFTEIGMAGAGAADNITWRSIWLATENMVERTTNLTRGSEAFYQEVGRRFVECVDKTQVVDSILHRTEIMRSKSMWVKLGTSFMGEPLKTWNMMADAVRAFVSDPSAVNRKRLAKTSFILLGAAGLQAVVNSLVSAFRHWSDEEPLEETFKKYLLGDYDGQKDFYGKAVEFLFGNNLAGELNPINYIPFARDLSDIIQGYDVTREDMATITNVVDKMSALIRGTGKASTVKQVAELAGAVGDMLGVPTSNLIKEAGFVSNWGARALESLGLNTMGVQYLKMKYDRELGLSSNKKLYVGFLENLEDAESLGKVEHGFVEQVRTELGEAYGEDTVETELGKSRLERLTGGSKASDYAAAIVQAYKVGDTEWAANIRTQWLRKGTSEQTISTEIRKALKADPEIVAAAQARKNGNMRTYTQTVDKFAGYGFDRDDVIKAVNAATNALDDKGEEQAGAKDATGTAAKELTTAGTEKKESEYGESYGYSYSDLSSAIADGSSYTPEILADLRQQGKTDKNIRSQVTSGVKPVYVDLMNSGRKEDRDRAEKIRKQLLSMGIGYTEKDIDAWLKK